MSLEEIHSQLHCLLARHKCISLVGTFLPISDAALVFRTGRGIELRDIDVRSCYEAIGTDHAKALLVFHTFTDCDKTGRFCGKSKTVWWKEFRKADESTLDALAKLGKTQNVHCISCKFYSIYKVSCIIYLS